MFSYGQRIKLIRKAIGINQTQLAEICNVTQRTIHKWEADASKITIDKISILIELGASPFFILMGEGNILNG